MVTYVLYGVGLLMVFLLYLSIRTLSKTLSEIKTSDREIARLRKDNASLGQILKLAE